MSFDPPLSNEIKWSISTSFPLQCSGGTPYSSQACLLTESGTSLTVSVYPGVQSVCILVGEFLRELSRSESRIHKK